MKKAIVWMAAVTMAVTAVFFALPRESATATETHESAAVRIASRMENEASTETAAVGQTEGTAQIATMSAENPAPIDVAAEIARAKQEWLDKEAALTHEVIPDDAETFAKGGVTYTVIRDCAGFQAIEENLAGNYIVANDLDMTEFTTPIGWGEAKEVPGFYYWEPDSFSGIFDGNNYKVKNLINLHKAPVVRVNSYVNDYRKYIYGLSLFNINYGTIRNLIIDKSCEIDCDQLSPSFSYSNLSFVAAYNCGVVENCFSHGAISMKGPDVYGDFDASGICSSLGNLNFYKDIEVIVRDCVNFGKIEIPSTYASVGGIFASAWIYYPTLASIKNLYNFGDMTGGAASGIGNYVFVKYNIDIDLHESATIYDSANYGRITVANSAISTRPAGGIQAGGEAKAVNCQNYGTVEGGECVGGISSEGFAVNCSNYGDVSGKKDVGGILGVGWSRWNREMTGNKQYGAVSGENYVGGIVGNSINLIVKNNLNAGDVTGVDRYVDGIVGGSRKIDSSIYEKNNYPPEQKDNVNTGRIESPGRTAYFRRVAARRNAWIIAGSVVGGAAIIGCAAVVVWIKRKKGKNKS